MTLIEKIESGKITGAYSIEREKFYIFENVLDGMILSNNGLIFTGRLIQGIEDGRWLPINSGFYCREFDKDDEDRGEIVVICDDCRLNHPAPYKNPNVEYYMTWEPLGCDGPRQCQECGCLVHTNDNRGTQL